MFCYQKIRRKILRRLHYELIALDPMRPRPFLVNKTRAEFMQQSDNYEKKITYVIPVIVNIFYDRFLIVRVHHELHRV